MARRFFSAGCCTAVTAVLAVCLSTPALAARPSGMEGLDNESGVNRIERRQFPQGAVAVDAYGNPVVPMEEEKKPRIRPGAGAYGGYGQPRPQERPLPDPDKGDEPVWSF